MRGLKRCNHCKAVIKSYSKTNLCRHCLAAKLKKEHRAKLKAESKCIDCGKKHDTPFVRCPKCKLKNQKKKNEN